MSSKEFSLQFCLFTLLTTLQHDFLSSNLMLEEFILFFILLFSFIFYYLLSIEHAIKSLSRFKLLFLIKAKIIFQRFAMYLSIIKGSIRIIYYQFQLNFIRNFVQIINTLNQNQKQLLLYYYYLHLMKNSYNTK